MNKKTAKDAVYDGRPMDGAGLPDGPATEEIRVRAYELYVQRGRMDGFDLEDWVQAEEELKQSRNKPTDDSCTAV